MASRSGAPICTCIRTRAQARIRTRVRTSTPALTQVGLCATPPVGHSLSLLGLSNSSAIADALGHTTARLGTTRHPCSTSTSVSPPPSLVRLQVHSPLRVGPPHPCHPHLTTPPRFDLLYKRRAHVHHFTQYVDPDALVGAREAVRAVVTEYNQHRDAAPPPEAAALLERIKHGVKIRS